MKSFNYLLLCFVLCLTFSCTPVVQAEDAAPSGFYTGDEDSIRPDNDKD